MYRVNPGGRRVQWADPGWATDADRARIPVMNADVILESTERLIILDTKYYKEMLETVGITARAKSAESP